MADLPSNIEDLLWQRTVEGDRIEYKAGWNPAAVMRTLCAFANDFENLGGGEIIEKSFRGPIHEEVRAALRFIQNEVIREKVIKRKDKAEAIRLFNYPFAAVEEAVVNAVYHRSYEQPEPVEVRVSPDRIEVVSYPGPDVSIRMAALNGGRLVARRYRNRRIGDFLKELDLTEGRCTGIPTMRTAMAENGSPPPRFATDEGRTYFFVELLVHPELPGIAKSHVKAHDGAHVEAHVRAHDGAHVRAHDGAHVKGHDEAHDGAHDGAHVRAHDGAHVKGHDEAHVQAHDGAHVEAHVEAHDGACVKEDDGGHVEAHDAAHVKTVWKMNPTESTILKFLENAPQSRLAIAVLLGLTSRSGHLYKAIFRLRDVGYVELTEPESPQSRNQKYRITEKGRAGLVRCET